MKRTQLSVLVAALFAAASVYADEAVISDISPIKTLPTELKNYFNWYQPMVGANTAYTLGARGKGVVVAVVDTGVDIYNPEFQGRLLRGYNAINPSALPRDDHGHGTHVAGIIGAAADGRMTVGIAPDVTLMPIKVLNAQGSGTQTAFNAGVNYAVRNGARILNMSLGAGGPFGQAGIQQAVSAGKLVVAAAGNSGAANPAWPARYASQSWTNGQVMAVGAVDSTGKIASFSNRAGDTRYNYLVAPGVSIASTYLNNQYVYMSGTSMATPVVSGAAADIWSRWMYLSAKQVANILYSTATHLGTSPTGTPDAVYGWGLVNLTKALQPVGTTTVTGSNKIRHALSRSGIRTNSLIKSSSFDGKTLIATDDFGRGYSYDMGQFAAKPATSDLGTLFSGMDKQMSMVERKTARSSLIASMYGAVGDMQKIGDPFYMAEYANPTLAGFNFLQQFGCQGDSCRGEYVVGTNGFADRYFGLSADYGNLPLSHSFANPYFQFAGSASHMGMGYEMGDGYKVKMGVLSSTNPLASQPTVGYASNSSGWVGEVEKKFERGSVRASLGGIDESGSVLGAEGTSAFAVDGAKTTYVGMSGAYRLNARDSLLAQAALGTTRSSGNAVILDSQARTIGWSLGYLRQDAWKNGDRLAFSVSQPMKVIDGSMNLALPTVDPSTGERGFDTGNINLASAKAQTDIELGYLAPLSKNTSWRLNAAHKRNADNESGNTNVVGMRYQLAF